MSLKEYPTLTALMQGREPGSVKVRHANWDVGRWARPARWMAGKAEWAAISHSGNALRLGDDGPWFIVSEDAPALDTLRLEIAAQFYAARLAAGGYPEERESLAEADALIEEARK